MPESLPNVPADAMTLPARYYTDREHFRRELERVYFEMWLYAGRAEEISEPGSYILVSLAEESVIVLRDREGGIRAFYNVCRHRGTRMVSERQGKLPGRIQCPYHAWTYDLEGTLVGAPHMDRTAGFSMTDYPLRSLLTEIWDGHVFINFSSRPDPIAQQLADLPQKFRAWKMADLRRAHRTVYEVKANWKLIIQNYSECLHCPVIHPQLTRVSHYLSSDNEPPQSTYLGGRMALRQGVQTMTMEGRTRRAALPGLGELEKTGIYYYAILPNLLLNLHPDYTMTYAIWPQAHDRTEIVCDWHFHPDEMSKPEFDPSDAVEFWDLTNRQDWNVSELAQLGIASRGYRPGPYSHRESLLYGMDQFIRERVGE